MPECGEDGQRMSVLCRANPNDRRIVQRSEIGIDFVVGYDREANPLRLGKPPAFEWFGLS